MDDITTTFFVQHHKTQIKKKLVLTGATNWSAFKKLVADAFKIDPKDVELFDSKGDKLKFSNFPSCVESNSTLILKPPNEPEPKLTDVSVEFVSLTLAAGSKSAYENGLFQILPHVFLGTVYSSRENEYLQTLKITHIVNCAREADNLFPSEFRYLNIPVGDRANEKIYTYFREACNFINRAKGIGGTVLVHCLGGISRSPTVILAYLIFEYKMSLSKAFFYVKGIKPRIEPNPGFMNQLIDFEQNILGKTSMKSVQF